MSDVAWRWELVWFLENGFIMMKKMSQGWV